MAEFTGDTGSLAKTGYAVRTDMVADSISSMTYRCVETDADEQDDPADGVQVDELCFVETTAKVSKLAESSAFSPDSQFLIVAKVTDSAGTAMPMGRAVTGRQISPSGAASITVLNGITNDKGEARLVATR